MLISHLLWRLSEIIASYDMQQKEKYREDCADVKQLLEHLYTSTWSICDWASSWWFPHTEPVQAPAGFVRLALIWLVIENLTCLGCCSATTKSCQSNQTLHRSRWHCCRLPHVCGSALPDILWNYFFQLFILYFLVYSWYRRHLLLAVDRDLATGEYKKQNLNIIDSHQKYIFF